LQGQYAPVYVSGPSSNRVDMVFMGDGYTSDQIPTTYWNDVQTLLVYLFGPPPPPIPPPLPPAPPPPINFDPYERDPYPRYWRFFNTWRIDVVSQDSGADNGSQLPQPRNTALNAGYGYGGGTTPLRFLYIDPDLGRSVLAQNLAGAPFTAEVSVVTVNDTVYGGGGGLFGYGPFAVYAAGNASARQVALHEIGHSFNLLADEYSSDGSGFYIGALGSRKTHAKRGERLKAQGARDSDIARIPAPIGLPIGAVSPSEIAVAIMAEITAQLRLPKEAAA
jgi:hypothetical protein